MRIKFYLYIFVFLLISTFSDIAFASKKNSQFPITNPPVLLECKTEATCDRVPKHFEKFISEFYIWYMSHEGPEHLEKNEYVEVHNFLKESLTRRLLKWENRVYSYTAYPNKDFCSLDTDVILCAQDWLMDWIYNAKIKTIRISNSKAFVFINLYPDYQLTVRLKVEDKVWKIDGVMRKY